MANSSLGLTFGLSSEMAGKLRQPSSTASNPLPILGQTSLEEATPDSPQPQQQSPTDAPLPCISIHLERLMGYQPTDYEEYESIRSQLLEAMWTRYRETSSDGEALDGPTTTTTQPPPDFDVQATELFESGVARYVDPTTTTTTNSANDSYSTGRLMIPYPPALQSPVTGERLLTRTILQQIRTHPRKPDILITLWKHLRDCSRPLLWKRDMSRELSHLVQEEQTRLEYFEWTATKRQSQLDSLYSVRETLVHQVDLAKEKVELLEEEREIQVADAMEPVRRKVVDPSKDSLGAFGTTDLSFPDEFQWLGLRDEPIDQEDDWGLSSDHKNNESTTYGSHDDDDDESDYSDGSEADEELSQNDDTQDGIKHENATSFGEERSEQAALAPADTTNELPAPFEEATADPDHAAATNDESSTQPTLSLPFQKRKERREKSKRRKQLSRKAAEQKARQEQLRKLEDELRSKLTSKDLMLAQTMYNALAEKMTKIEDLLDSLQDEVWQAEEEAELQKGNSKDDDEVEPAFSLLDQVLAMILGAMPMPDGLAPAKHYERMQQEHRSIVAAWKAHFGRLPPPAIASQSPTRPEPDAPLSSKELRKDLGITDNNDDDWEAVDDWDDLLDSKKSKINKGSSTPNTNADPPALQSSKSTTTKPSKTPEPPATKLVGLRPGGRAIIRQGEI